MIPAGADIRIERVSNGFIVIATGQVQRDPQRMVFDTLNRLVDWLAGHYARAESTGVVSPYPRTRDDPFGMFGPQIRGGTERPSTEHTNEDLVRVPMRDAVLRHEDLVQSRTF